MGRFADLHRKATNAFPAAWVAPPTKTSGGIGETFRINMASRRGGAVARDGLSDSFAKWTGRVAWNGRMFPALRRATWLGPRDRRPRPLILTNSEHVETLVQ